MLVIKIIVLIIALIAIMVVYGTISIANILQIKERLLNAQKVRHRLISLMT